MKQILSLNECLELDPFSLERTSKKAFLDESLNELTRFHYKNCLEYRKMLDAYGFAIQSFVPYENLPFIPVRLFKELELLSVDKCEIVKTMSSSGTTGQNVSKIFLDRQTASDQTRVLTKIVSSVLGKARVPMIILDSPSVIKNRNSFSARGAGILGFSMFGSDRYYLLDDNMDFDFSGLEKFLIKHQDKTIFMFGFTFIIWQHFFKTLMKQSLTPDLSRAILFHGGGWKNLANEAVSQEQFKEKLNSVCGIKPSNIHDYYGFVEQTGTINVECEHGFLHPSIFSDIIIRRTSDFSAASIGEEGLIQVVSTLPKSYPGHSLLTEDVGSYFGEDTCKCGRKGKFFKVFGRIKNAELRGCSDTYSYANK
jgi:phenylacetate-coenzyme A ligase PaaK-like adenylate-forming protein